MKRYCLLFLLSITAFTYGQVSNKNDSVTIIIENVSKFKFEQYLAVINGHTISGKTLMPGKSATFKIPLAGKDLYRFTIYLDRKKEDKYSIEPLDYYSQISDLEITKGTYKYSIDIKERDAPLSIKLEKI